MVNDDEQNSTSNLTSLKTKISNIQAMRTKINNLVQESATTGERAKLLQAAAEEKLDKLRQLYKQQQHEESKKQELQAALDALDHQNNTEQAAQGMQLMLNNLGCTLQIADGKENTCVYKFEFPQQRCIAIEYDGCRFALLEITPTPTNFAEIKLFMEETQDLMGLLMHF